MVFFNVTSSIGIILGQATQYTTGSMFLTLFIVLMLILAIAFMFGIPLEFTAIIILPLMLSYMAYYGEFITIGLVLLCYIALVVTKKFIFN